MAELEKIIEERLRNGLSPTILQVTDDSAQHLGHAGARGGGHFSVLLVAEEFEGKSLMEQHRRVHELLSDLLEDKVHALALRTYAPSQWKG